MEISTLPGWYRLQPILPHFPAADINTGPWVAGGVIARLAADAPIHYSKVRNCFETRFGADFDYWCRDATQYQQIVNHCRGWDVLSETNNAITYLYTVDDTRYGIQVIRRSYFSDWQHLVKEFDFSVSRAVTDFHTLMASDHTMDHLRRKVFDRVGLTNEDALMVRFLKYMEMGYCPEPSLVEELANLPSDVYQTAQMKLSSFGQYRGF